MGFQINAQLTPATAIERLGANDSTLVVCDLSRSAVMQMKGVELMPKLAEALAKNTCCTELKLADCNISDEIVPSLAAALVKNTSLASLDLEGNKVGNDGATSLAKALANNRSLMVLNLFGQKASTKLGDATLHAFCDMFETNVTLLKITWRLDSRQSFRINKLIVRNNDIDRRLKAGREYSDLLPTGVAPLSAETVAQRDMAASLVGTLNSARAHSSVSLTRASQMSTSELQTENSPPGGAAAPAAGRRSQNSVLMAETLKAALASLDAEYERESAKLKASFDQRRKALITSHGSDAAVPLN